MIIIKHRVNTSKELKKLSINFGAEIDLRSNNKDIYLHHDPFKKGELFSNCHGWLVPGYVGGPTAGSGDARLFEQHRKHR